MIDGNDNGLDIWQINDSSDEFSESSEEDIFDDISAMSFSDEIICIKANDNDSKNFRLKRTEEDLYRKYPKFKEIPSEERIQEILRGVFPEGFVKRMYVRNLTFTNRNGFDIKLLGIRPERTLGDFLSDYIPDGTSLLFKGHIGGKQFVVDAVYEVADTDKLDYEVYVSATPYNTPERIRANFLYDILDDAASLTAYTSEKLEEWKEYLRWKRELARRQIFGCKYFKVEFDEVKRRLLFSLVFENEDEFKSFKRYLSRDIQVFDNSYSKDNWHFVFAGDNKGKYQRYNSVEVGRYRGIVNSYYLKSEDDGKADPNDTEYYMTDGEWDDAWDDEDDDQKENSERDIARVFKTPYIVQVAYELSRNTIDDINQRGFDDAEAIQYIYDNVFGNYFSNGFIALSAVGDFVLINRFQRAIEQLESDQKAMKSKLISGSIRELGTMKTKKKQ